MIPQLASPSVCVIDDEESEYRPILDALMTLGLGCVHVRGGSGDPLPPQPFDSLRVVFTDLHLSGQVGKAAASHTANVVKSVISPSSGPVLIVVWSKYAADPAGDPSLPPEDQPTEADLFMQELLSAEPRFQARLIFADMAKPKLPDQPAREEWTTTLRPQIEAVLGRTGGVDLLWTWEALVCGAAIHVSETLAKLIETNVDGGLPGEELKLLLRVLAQQQGGPDCSAATAPRHVLTVLSQIASDLLETNSSYARLDAHAAWLAEKVDKDVRKKTTPSARLNSVLLTASADPSSATFVPGTVYDVVDMAAMAAATHFTVENLQRDCFARDPTSSAFDMFQAGVLQNAF